MDTTFWGPDGWVLLHTLTYFLPEKLSKKEQLSVKEFFNNVSKILPCKYCRISNQKYMRSLNIDDYSSTRDTLTHWIYKLHNKVNNKLRKQGYCIYDNPPFEEIDTIYKSTRLIYMNDPTKCIELLICNKFIGSIVFNYPNYLRNCNPKITHQELRELYVDFFNQLVIYSTLVNHKCGTKFKSYLDSNPLEKVLTFENSVDEHGKEMYDMTLEQKLKLYQWYFKLCKTYGYHHPLSKDNSIGGKSTDVKSKRLLTKKNKKVKIHRKELDGFCSKFKKYIVKTCSDPKNVKTQKNVNTCRKLI